MKGTFKGRPYLVTPVMEERILLVAYEDGSWFDRLIVHHVRRQNPRVEALYQAHRNAVRDVRLAAQEICCPGNLSERLESIAGTDEVSLPWYVGLGQGLRSLQAVSAVAAIAVVSFLMVQHWQEPKITDYELQQATLEAKASLALISEIMNGTRDTLHREVLLEQTARPLRESIYQGTVTIKNNL